MKKNISIHSLNETFTFLNNQPNQVFWIMNNDFSSQLYVNQSFESIWQQKKEVLFNDVRSFNEFVLKDNHLAAITQLDNKTRRDIDANFHSNILLYRIILPNGDYEYIRDESINIVNQHGELVANAGLAEKIRAEDWYNLLDGSLEPLYNDSDEKDMLMKALSHEFDLSTQNTAPPIQSQCPQFPKTTIIMLENGYPLKISKRQAECIFHLMQGNSAKETGSLLHLSQRTVETYLEHLKKKLNCRTKIDILNKICKKSFYKYSVEHGAA